jgi:HEAT repeat protein
MALLVATALLCVMLMGFTVVRKLRRDRNEALSLTRRERFRDLLLSARPGTLSAELRRVARKHHAQVDLLAALDVAWPKLDSSRREAIQQSIDAARFDEALVRRLRSHDAVVRATAALLVGRLRLPNASRVIAPLVRDPDSDVRLVAVRALADLADGSAARVLIATLSSSLLEPERLIERLGNDWAVDTILEVLEQGRDGLGAGGTSGPVAVAWQPIRASLARALGLAGDPAAEPVLRSMLRTGSFEERVSAARALGTAGSAVAVPDLEAALGDAEWQLRAQAARSLGVLGAETGVPALASCLSDSAWWVRAAAADALGHLGEPGLLALQGALAAPDPYARDRAREALALHGLAVDDQ